MVYERLVVGSCLRGEGAVYERQVEEWCMRSRWRDSLPEAGGGVVYEK